jgi:hypothetical protein
MTGLDPVRLTASIDRALWGEVSGGLHSVRFSAGGRQITLRFFFLGDLDESDRASIASVGAEVAADFPASAVSEQAVATEADSAIRGGQGWHTVFLRKEPALVG